MDLTYYYSMIIIEGLDVSKITEDYFRNPSQSQSYLS